jgi:hypothetical protein
VVFVSSIVWKGPKVELPQGLYQFRRLGLRDLRELYSIWTQYQTDTAKRLHLSLSDLEDPDSDMKEEIGRSVYDLALQAPDRAFEWIFSTLVPVAGTGKDKTVPPTLHAKDAEDENVTPIWFLTTYIESLLNHKDFDRFFTELVSLLRKEGKLRTKIRKLTGSGKSKDKPDGETTKS